MGDLLSTVASLNHGALSSLLKLRFCIRWESDLLLKAVEASWSPRTAGILISKSSKENTVDTLADPPPWQCFHPRAHLLLLSSQLRYAVTMATDATEPNYDMHLEVTQSKGGPGKQDFKRCFQWRPKETVQQQVASWGRVDLSLIFVFCLCDLCFPEHRLFRKFMVWWWVCCAVETPSSLN